MVGGDFGTLEFVPPLVSEPILNKGGTNLTVRADAQVAPLAVPSQAELEPLMFVIPGSLSHGFASQVGESQFPSVHVAAPEAVYPVSQRNKP